MENVELDGVRVEYELLGDSDPVVLPPARPFVRWYEPLAAALDRAATVGLLPPQAHGVLER